MTQPNITPRHLEYEGDGWRAYREDFEQDGEKVVFIHIDTDRFNKSIVKDIKTRFFTWIMDRYQEGYGEVFTWVAEYDADMKRLPKFLGFKEIQTVYHDNLKYWLYAYDIEEAL